MENVPPSIFKYGRLSFVLVVVEMAVVDEKEEVVAVVKVLVVLVVLVEVIGVVVVVVVVVVDVVEVVDLVERWDVVDNRHSLEYGAFVVMSASSWGKQ